MKATARRMGYEAHESLGLFAGSAASASRAGTAPTKFTLTGSSPSMRGTVFESWADARNGRRYRPAKVAIIAYLAFHGD